MVSGSSQSRRRPTLPVAVEPVPGGGVRLAERPDTLDPASLCEALMTSLSVGLTEEEAALRCRSFGPNQLAPPRRDGPVRRFVRQLAEPMAVLLIVAAAVSGLALAETVDAAAIAAIVVLNATISFAQEGRAARALESLRELEAPHATVLRDGRAQRARARDLVLGDVIVLRPGDRVPADARLVESASLEIDESLLTGESIPVHKDVLAGPAPGAGIADRPGMVFDGTLVTRGTGRAVVSATGMGSEIGAIAGRLSLPERATPLQRDLRALVLRIGLAAVLVAVGVAAVLLVRGGLAARTVEQAFLVAVALAVAAVPEGLAAVNTVALSLGVKRMADRGGIVRRLPAVETLGSTTVLAIDKTGTLTENQMRLERLVASDGTAFDPAAEEPRSRIVAEIVALCSDAGTDPPTGDPLEIALLLAVGSERAGSIRRSFERIACVPFDPERKRMTAVHRSGQRFIVTVKGAPERVVERCRSALAVTGEVVEPLDRETVLASNEAMARTGLRVLALAFKEVVEPKDLDTEEQDLVFVALAALKDPVRAEAADAVRRAREAGVRLVMVTGDHPATAASVAGEVGLADRDGRVLSGAELREHGIPDDPSTVSVYARVDPGQKLELVERWQELGEVVAVTGDGANDAPALHRADIGVALGRSGTDVAREAADLVITDDNLATLVAAMAEGRGIYANIRKVVDYLLTCNLSEVATVALALLLFPDIGVPLVPLQLLWMNLVTDGLPALALGTDPADPEIMHRAPRRPGEPILDRRAAVHLGSRAFVLAAAALGSLAVSRYVLGEPWPHARVAMFTVLVTAQLVYAFAARVMRDDGRPLGPTRFIRSVAANRPLVGAVVVGLSLQVMILTLPAARVVFSTHPLVAAEWLLVTVAAILVAVALMALPSLRGANGHARPVRGAPGPPSARAPLGP